MRILGRQGQIDGCYMKNKLFNKENKKALCWSALLGFMVMSVLSFRYIQPKIKPSHVLVESLDKLRQWFGGYGFLNGLFALLLAGFIFATIKHIQKKREPFLKFLGFISLVFGTLNVFGLMMFYLDDLPFFESAAWGCVTLYLIAGWSVLFYFAAHWVLCGLQHLYTVGEGQLSGKKGWFLTLFDQHPFGVSYCIILLCWLPWVLSYYPASMDWDVYLQISSTMSFGKWVPSNHHPWFSSWVLTQFFKLGRAMGSDNAGIFIFVCLRDLLIVAIYSQCVSLLHKSGVKRWICLMTMFYYAVTPVWGAYAKHGFKDTFSTALFCAYMTSLIVIVLRAKEGQLRWPDCLWYGFITLMTSLFRNNPIYAMAPATVLLMIFLFTRKLDWKKIVVLPLGAILFFGINHYALNYGGILPGRSVEALSIPVQQTGRTVKYHGDTITPQEKQAINGYLDYPSMAGMYDPLVSDPIKNRCKERTCGAGAIKAYYKTWLRMFPKYPDTYIEATIGNSYGYYAFTPRLPKGAGNSNSGMTIFNWIHVKAFDKFHFGFHYLEGSETPRGLLDMWAKVWDSLPVLSLTNTIAAYTWLTVLIGYDLLRKKKWPELIPVFVLCVMILTCIASPVNDCFRYYSIVAASVPLLPLLLNYNKKAARTAAESTRKIAAQEGK